LIKVLNEQTNYWLVRTAGGAFYEQFVAGSYIAIGWNEVSDLDLIKGSKEDEAKKDRVLKTIREYVDKDAEKETQPKGERERETQKSRIFNQINRFVNEMAIGDFILIPSQRSNLIEFGTITSDSDIFKKEFGDFEEGECDFIKRRKVTWLHRENRDQLDPYLYGLIYSQHAISSANDYAHFIDRAVNRFFIKGNKAHMILEAGKESDNSCLELVRLLNSLLDLVDGFNRVTGSELNKDSVQVKINVQSNGLIELFGHVDVIAIIGLVLAALFGGKVSLFKLINFESTGLLELVKGFIAQNQNNALEREKLALQREMQTLNVKTPPELQITGQDEEQADTKNI